MNTLKPVLGRLAAGEHLAESEAEAAFGIIMAGEATPAQIAGLLMAMRVRGETVPEITGAVRAMRARMAAIEAPARSHRHRRHRRRRLGQSQHLDRDCAGRRRLRRAGGQARQPGALLEIRCGGCAGSARGQPRRPARPAGGRAGRGRHGLPLGAAAPFLHAARRRPAGRARHPDHLQHPRPALEPCPGEAPADRRLFRRMAAADGGNPGPARHRGAPGWCMARGWTRSPCPGKPRWSRWRTAGSANSPSTPEDAGLERAPPEAIRGGEPAENAAALHALLQGAPGAYRDIVLLNAAAALVVAGRAADLRAGAAIAARAIDSGAASGVLARLKEATSP